jgi:type IV secretion system protein VirB10
MEGLDAQGNAGLRDKVDHHYKQLLGVAVLTSMFDAALAITQSRQQSVLLYPSPTQETEGAAGRDVSQLGAQITRKNLNVQPTIKIPAGYKFNVRVNRDIVFEEPYRSLQPLSTDVLAGGSPK